MPTADKPFLVINPPGPEDTGAYVLVVTRPGGGLLGGSQSVFLVDGLAHEGTGEGSYLRGYREGEGVEALVVEFPAYVPYMLVNRVRTSFMTQAEMEAETGVAGPEHVSLPIGNQHTGPSPLLPGQYL